MRSGTTFKKRQKEIARMEKQRDKAARRVQRKAEKLSGTSSTEDEFSLEPDDSAEPGESAETPESHETVQNAGSPETAQSAGSAPAHE
jgi:hypothetical protein